MVEETTNDILESLVKDISLEAVDAANMGDRQTAGVLQRLSNALHRNITRRNEQEAAEAEADPLDQLPTAEGAE